MVSSSAQPNLPSPVMALLDGQDLERKIGETILLAASEPSDWPRLALLSVGEVIAPSETEIGLVLYPGSRTTAALTASQRALLLVVVDGTFYKIHVRTERQGTGSRGGLPYALFHGTVHEVVEDSVGYARVLHGIEYALTTDASEEVLARWRRQLKLLSRPDRA